MHACMHIYTDREREREKKRKRERDICSLQCNVHTCYVYPYTDSTTENFIGKI